MSAAVVSSAGAGAGAASTVSTSSGYTSTTRRNGVGSTTGGGTTRSHVGSNVGGGGVSLPQQQQRSQHQHGMIITASQAWSILRRHARDDIDPLRLHELCRDKDRVSSLVAVYNTTAITNSLQSTETQSEDNRILIVDLSRQRMTLETLNHLLKLATARNLRRFITQLAWGQNDPRNPIRPSRADNNNTANNYYNNKMDLSQRTGGYNQHAPHSPTRSATHTEATSHSSPLRVRPPKSTRFSSASTAPPATFPLSSPAASSFATASQQQQHPPNQTHTHYHVNSTTTTTTDASVVCCPSLHMALRVPRNQGYEMLVWQQTQEAAACIPRNALMDIHSEWDRIERFSDSIRRGQLRGVTGKLLTNVIVVGRGVAIQALKFLYQALLNDERAALAAQVGGESMSMNMSMMSNTNINNSDASSSAADGIGLSAAAAAAAVGGANTNLAAGSTSSASVVSGGINQFSASASQVASSVSTRIRRGVILGAAAMGTAAGGGGGGSAGTSSGGGATEGFARRRHLRFVTSIDPLAVTSVMADLDPASTLVISIALNGNEETGLATKMLKTWLLQSLGGTTTGSGLFSSTAAATPTTSGGCSSHCNTSNNNSNTGPSASANNNNSNSTADYILAKHMVLITGNDRIVSVINKPQSVFVVPEHSRCEPFTTFSVIGLLPLSIIFGFHPIVSDVLQGAHDMDKHFVETNPRHNLPVLLALTDIWNDTFLRMPARVITPSTQALQGFPAFVAALEAQTCGGVASSSSHHHPADHTTSYDSNSQQHQTSAGGSGAHYGIPITGGGAGGGRHGSFQCSSIVIDGAMGESYDRSLYQGSSILNSEMIMVMDSQVTFNISRAGSTTSNTAAATNGGGIGSAIIGGLGGGAGSSSRQPYHQSTTNTAAAMEDMHSSEDSLLCSVFAKMDELAFGRDNSHSFVGAFRGASAAASATGGGSSGGNTSVQQRQQQQQQHGINFLYNHHMMNQQQHLSSEGNRPSILVMVGGKLDAFACGQLIALSEHRAIVKAHISGLDPFVRETGSALHMYRTDQLKESLQNLLSKNNEDVDDEEEDDDDGDEDAAEHAGNRNGGGGGGNHDDDDEEEDENGVESSGIGGGRNNSNKNPMHLSTKTLLQHYANVQRNRRQQGLRKQPPPAAS